MIIRHALKTLHGASRPVLILGAGARSAMPHITRLLDMMNLPVCLTWGAADMLPDDDARRVGTFGTHGTRAANYAAQNADMLLCIGTRLDTKATGTPAEWFARGAEIIMVDIDPRETNKMQAVGVMVSPVNMDAALFSARIADCAADMLSNDLNCSTWHRPDWQSWLTRCQQWRSAYPPGPGAGYDAIRRISDAAQPGDVIVSDTGCVLAWAMQAWRFKAGQRFLHPFNQTPMGYALPAAVGAHYATGRRVIVLTGDGSIMMNLGELATIAQRRLPVDIYLFDNKGHAMCRQTQREWMGGTYPTTSIEGGLSFPDFRRLAVAFGVNMTVIDIPADEDVNPKAKFGFPNEDQYPHLPREEFMRNMLIDPVNKPAEAA